MEKSLRGQAPEDPNAVAHTVCMSTKLGYIDADGKIVAAKIRERVGPLVNDNDLLEKIVTECAVNKDNVDDTAMALGDCLRKATTTKH